VNTNSTLHTQNHAIFIKHLWGKGIILPLNLNIKMITFRQRFFGISSCDDSGVRWFAWKIYIRIL